MIVDYNPEQLEVGNSVVSEILSSTDVLQEDVNSIFKAIKSLGSEYKVNLDDVISTNSIDSEIENFKNEIYLDSKLAATQAGYLDEYNRGGKGEAASEKLRFLLSETANKFVQAIGITNLSSDVINQSVTKTKEEAFKRGLSEEQREEIIKEAESQLKVPYNSMHYNEDGKGFGCAMFVSYCYNQTLFNGVSGQSRDTPGFYGSTWDYWGNVVDGYDAYNKTFRELKDGEQPLPGDVVAYTLGDNPYEDATACNHVALYIGNGNVIGAWGEGADEEAWGEVITCPVEDQAAGRDIHYLRYIPEDKK